MSLRPTILQVSTADERGGAESVARNLFREYRLRGYRSQMAVGFKMEDDPDIFVVPNEDVRGGWERFWLQRSAALESLDVGGASRAARLARLAGQPAKVIDQWIGVEDFHFAGTRRILGLADSPDIVHCHNLHGGYFDLRALQWLSAQRPVVITMHDAWLLSGHCVHSLACERWETGCGSCPDLTLYPAIRRDATGHNWRRKRRIYERSRLYVATPCQWLMDKVHRSILKEGTVATKVIPHGVDLTQFHPTPRAIVREQLAIPADADVLVFAANRVRQNIWKDYATMRTAVEMVSAIAKGKRTIFIALGDVGGPERIGSAEVRFVPYEKDPKAVARYYSAADLYIHAARVDTFPNVILEALACGVPVVGTAVGGIPEQLKGLSCFGANIHPLNTHCADSATGILVPPGEPEAMAHAIVSLLRDAGLRTQMSVNAAADARLRFDLQRHVTDYLNFYGEILDGHAARTDR
jgi:glycosyltransferase involved in cell wall biosynthesis